MTAPFTGNASDEYYKQLQLFNAQRDEFYKNFFNQTAVAGQVTGMQQPSGVPFTGQTATQQGAATIPPEHTWEDADLLGAAKFWGIDENVARQMPREALLAHLNQLRSQNRPSEDTAQDRLKQAGIMLASMPAMAALGVGEAITGGLGNLPFIGGAMKKLQPLHDADLWLRSLEEGVRSSNPEDFKLALGSAEVAGNLAGMWYPGAGAWALSGRIIGGTRLVAGERVAAGLFKGSPILRASLQGSLSGEMLEGGGEHPFLAGAFGAVLGGAGGALARPAVAEYLSAAAAKISKKFVSPAVFQEMGPVALDRPMIKMENTSDFTQIATRAMQGDEEAIAMMQSLQQTGQMPRPQATVYRENPGYQASMRSERSIFPGGYTPAGMNTKTAETAAIQMNKAGQIIESPMLPQAVKSVQPDELTVAFAAQSSNPGGVNIVEGIVDPAPFGALGDNVAFAQRKGRLAALVSDEPITPNMVHEFETHGMFTGQQVIVPGGREMTIAGIENGRALIHDPYSGSTHSLPLDRLSPSLQSPGVHAVPQLWDDFTQYAEMQATITQAEMGGALQPEQLQTIKNSSMQQWMEDFLDTIGVAKAGDRARVKNYFNHRWVEDISSLHPEQKAQNLAAQADLAEAINSHPPTELGRVDDLAASKGFTAIPNGEGGWILMKAGPLDNQPIGMKFDSLEAAETHLAKLNVELPDVSPNLPVPGELMGVVTREPPVEMNVNHKFTEQIDNSVMSMTDGAGVPPVNPADIQQAKGDGNFGRLNNLWKDGFMRWVPARRVFGVMSEDIRQSAGNDFGVAGVYDGIGVKLNQHHTAMAPVQNELAEVFKNSHIGSTKRLLNGEWIDVWSIKDPAARLAKAQANGWGDKDIASLSSFDDLLRKIHSDESAGNELRDLVTHARQQVSVGQDPWQGFQAGRTTADFYEVAKGADFGLREMDPRRLGDTYIRSVFWKRDMAEAYNAGMEVAKNLKGVTQLKGAGEFLENWLKIVKEGYRPQDDIALDGLHALGRAVLGKSFSRQQARELASMGLNTTHASMLGFRVHVMARDALQLFFAIPRAGKELTEVISQFTTDAAFRNEVWSEVFSEGAASAMMPRQASPGAFFGELEASAADMPVEGMSRRMQAVGKATGFLRDIAPGFLKGSSENITQPLYLYGKQGQMMRTLVYKAGKLKAERALESFATHGDLDKLMGESGARTFDRAWQEQFRQLVASGDKEKAAQFLGRQLTDATQFKYGVTESPAAARSVTGRMFFQMGSYQTQYLQYLRESLSNGTFADRAKVALSIGAVSAGLEAASRSTGWNFRKMNPYAIGFFGGPWVSTGAALLQGGAAAARTLQGDGSVTPFNERAMNAGLNAAGDAVSALNPLNGLYQTATGLGSAINDSPLPGQAIGRLMITGERGALPDILNTIGMGEVQQTPTPVRMGQFSLMGTPQLEPAYPSGMAVNQPNGQVGSGYVPQPSVTPLPGGGASGPRPAAGVDSTFIPFTANVQSGMPNGYNVSVVQEYLMNARYGGQAERDYNKVFWPQDKALLDSLIDVPVEQAIEIFRGELQQRVQTEATQGRRNPGGGYNPNNPGSGGMF